MIAEHVKYWEKVRYGNRTAGNHSDGQVTDGGGSSDNGGRLTRESDPHESRGGGGGALARIGSKSSASASESGMAGYDY